MRASFLALLLILCVGLPVQAQAPDFVRSQDTLSSNGDAFVVPVRGYASARLQTLDSYSGTWEVQCSVDDGTTYDTDDEVNLSLEGASAAAVQEVTDTVAIYTATVAGCTHIKVIATAGFAASDTTIAVAAIVSGGSSGGGGGGSVTQGTSPWVITGAVVGAYANDATAATNDRLPTLPVITETSAPSRTNGRSAALSGFAGGGIRVVLVDAAGAAITLASDKVDEADFTYATSTVTSIGAAAESTTDTLADGKIGVPVMTLSRFLRTTPSGYLGGGGVPVNMLSDSSDNEDETAICTGPCTVYSIVAFNHTAASAFLRCENDTAANTTPGSETASDGEFDLEIPASTTGAGFTYAPGGGIGASFATALTCWIVSGEASSDTTDVAANDVRVQFVRVQ